MIFAYGATGSGKTHTMMTMNSFTYNKSAKIEFSECGIVIQAIKDLFTCIQEQQDRFIVSSPFQVPT